MNPRTTDQTRECTSADQRRASSDPQPRPQDRDPSSGEREHATTVDSADLRRMLAASLRTADATTPRQIGHYRIRRVADVGGMAIVYEALQEDPRRSVALKVMKQGICSASALRRFRYETQVLARLRHPCIAQIYEAGMHDSGEGAVPYFAMEFIPGATPITDYAAKRSLSTTDRLRLFADVCAAVHHGHEKGVIHRDLKPSNILVGADGQPKVIDFGVARSTDSDLSVTTLQTSVGQLVGTLQYMSPEQCEANPHELDIRSDVYSLGVVFYELLCHRLPYDLHNVGVYEATRMIRESMPKRPSTVDRRLRGDVETIALKALERDRERRYQSAAAFREDILRFLNHEPIEASAPDPLYMLLRFLRTHRLFTAATGGVALGLIVALLSPGGMQRGLATIVGLVLVAAGGLAGAVGFVCAVRSRAHARTQEERAAGESARAGALSAFLGDVLVAMDPAQEGRDVSVVEVLDRATQDIDRYVSDQPVVEASIRDTIGNYYRTLGQYDAAMTHLTQALAIRQATDGDASVAALETRSGLAALLFDRGKLDAAQAEARRAADGLTQQLGHRHLSAIKVRYLLARIITARGRYDEGETLFNGVLEDARQTLGDEHPFVMSAMDNLALAQQERGELADASRLARRTLEMRQRILGEEHPDTLVSLNNLALMLHERGRGDEAESMMRDAVERRRRVLGTTHPATAISTGNLAMILRARGQAVEAESLARETLQIRRTVLGRRHYETLRSMNNLGAILQDREKHEEAEYLTREALEGFTEALGADHIDVLKVLSNLGRLQRCRGNSEAAAETFARLVHRAESALSPGNWTTAVFRGYYGGILMDLGRLDDAAEQLGRAHTDLEASLGPDHTRTQQVAQDLELLNGLIDSPDARTATD
jgi:tetratricopeptide (TPR) repeat protein